MHGDAPTTTRRWVDKKATPVEKRRPTANSRASSTRTATPTTSRRRRAQGDLPGPRRARRPGEAQEYDRGGGGGGGAPARSRPARARRRLRRLRQLRLRRLLDGDILSNLFGGSASGGRAAHETARRERAPTSRRRSRSLRPGRLWRAGCRCRCRWPRLRDLPRHRRKPGHDAEGVPGLRGPRHRDAGPGHVLDLPALLTLRRLGTVIEDPARPATARAPCARQAAAGQYPRGRARRQAHPPARQGRARAAAAARPATCT